MIRTVIESPYKPLEHRDRNLRYLRALALFALDEGLAPYASHGLLTHWLDDENEQQRRLGIQVGLTWSLSAELVIFGMDYGMSSGMERALIFHRARRQRVALPIWFVKLGSQWETWEEIYGTSMASEEPAWKLPGFEALVEWHELDTPKLLLWPRTGQTL